MKDTLKAPQVSPVTIAFLLPAIIYTFVMMLASQTPFGENAMIFSDSAHQYFPFFLELKRALQAGEGLQWSWTQGMGTAQLHTIAYYTASPLNLIALLLPNNLLLNYFCLLVPIKLSLAGGFMAFLLKKLNGRSDWALPFFSCLYAFCGWALLYFWNIMWLDGMYLLPLVTWATIQLLRERKTLGYTLSIAATLLINYYIAIFVFTFVLLLFICYQFCKWEGTAKLRKDFFRIALFTVIALCLTAILFIPAAATLFQSYSASSGYIPEVFPSYLIPNEDQAEATALWKEYNEALDTGAPAGRPLIGAIKETVPLLFTALSRIINHTAICSYIENSLENPPATYSGMASLVLIFLTLISHTKPKKEKLAYIGIIGFYLMGMLFNDATYILHGFHYPAQLPYRFTFVVSFVVIITAYEAWLQRSRFKVWQVLAAGGATAAFLLLSRHFREGENTGLALLLIGMFTVGLLCYYFAAQKDCEAQQATKDAQPQPTAKKHTKFYRRTATTLCAAILLAECAITPFMAAIYHKDSPVNATKLQANLDNTHKVLSHLEDNAPYYRMENCEALTCNDGSLYGYNGISFYASGVNQRNTEYIIALGGGCSVHNNRAFMGNGSPVSLLFLNMKYLLCTDDAAANNPFYELVVEEDETSIYRNTAYLPLGFLADDAIASLTFKTDNDDPFKFQNELFSAATGIREPVYTDIADDKWTCEAEAEVTLTEGDDPNSYTGLNNGSEEDVGYSYYYTVEQSGFLSLHLTVGNNEPNYVIYKNEARLFGDTVMEDQHLFSVGTVEEGDLIRVQVLCPPKEEGDNASDCEVTTTLHGAILDTDLFQQGYEQLSKTTMKITEFKSTYVAGTISCPKDSFLYTSIPQDGNWVAYVDGEKADTRLTGGTMLCLDLSAGEHTIEFRYRSTAFVIGCILTILGVAALVILHCLPKRKPGKQPDGEPAAPAPAEQEEPREVSTTDETIASQEREAESPMES